MSAKSRLENLSIDYTKLQQLLINRQLQEADLETRTIMLKITGADTQEDLLMSRSQILQFPCSHLATIDKIWTQFSQARFGFSVISQIYQEVNQDYAKLAEVVGWRKGDQWISYQEINFTMTAPKGHLPITWLVPSTFGMYWLARFASPGWRSILERVAECQM